MPKYYIDVRDRAELIPDQEGRDFIDLDAALEEAKASACDVARQYMEQHMPLDQTSVEVRDAYGAVVAAVAVVEVLRHPAQPHIAHDIEAERRP